MMNLLLPAAIAASTPVLAVAASTPAPAPGEIKLFRDWAAGCDNVKDCEAQAQIADGTDNGAILVVRRAAGPGSQPTIAIPGGGAAAAAVLIDGRRVPQSLRVKDGEILFGPLASATLLPLLLKGSRLEVIDDKGLVVGVVSLAGASAALLYVDEQQGRLGTQTALIRPGAKPPTTVPPRAAPPAIAVPPADRAAPAARLAAAPLARLRTDSGCAREENGLDGESWLRLDASHTLLLLSCGAGAYNFTSAAFVIESSGGKRPKLSSTPATFDFQPSWGEATAVPMLVNAAWNAKSGVLRSYSKGRGLGDCGSSESYAWDGAVFRLTEQRAMNECRGSIHWIRTWTAETVPSK